jgi:hypothetical protein
MFHQLKEVVNKYLFISLVLIFSACSEKKSNLDKIDVKCEGFWYKNTYYGNKKIHTSVLLSKDTIPIKIISYRKDGSIEAEFLFGKDRDSLGYGLVIHYDSSSLNKIENVEVVGISRSDIWKGYTLFYREPEIMKIDTSSYKKWKEKINVEGKNYYFDW